MNFSHNLFHPVLFSVFSTNFTVDDVKNDGEGFEVDTVQCYTNGSDVSIISRSEGGSAIKQVK